MSSIAASDLEGGASQPAVEGHIEDSAVTGKGQKCVIKAGVSKMGIFSVNRYANDPLRKNSPNYTDGVKVQGV